MLSPYAPPQLVIQSIAGILFLSLLIVLPRLTKEPATTSILSVIAILPVLIASIWVLWFWHFIRGGWVMGPEPSEVFRRHLVSLSSGVCLSSGMTIIIVARGILAIYRN